MFHLGARSASKTLLFILSISLGSGTLTFAQNDGPGFNSAVQTSCAPYLNDCSYYACRESLQPCGTDGYWLRFGFHYCEGFMGRVRPQLSQEGQEWMDRVGRCLREKAEGFSLEASCEDADTAAISSHSSCYLQTGFCQISFLEKMKVLRLIYRELSDSRILKEVLEISKGCGVSLLHPNPNHHLTQPS